MSGKSEGLEEAKHLGRPLEHADVRAGEGSIAGLELEIEMRPPPVAEVQCRRRSTYPSAERSKLVDVVGGGKHV
jgi:hypothetical protein